MNSFNQLNNQAQQEKHREIRIDLVRESWSFFKQNGNEVCGELLFKNVFMLAPTIIYACPFRDELDIFKSFSFKTFAL